MMQYDRRPAERNKHKLAKNDGFTLWIWLLILVAFLLSLLK